MQQRELAADAPWQQRRVLVVRLHHEPKTLELSEVVGVWSVVTIGIRTSRRSARTCAPALPPKIPYSCCTESTSI
jgi:hypothetical protein